MKSKITIRNVTELLLQIIMIGIGFLTPSFEFQCDENGSWHTDITILKINTVGKIGERYHFYVYDFPIINLIKIISVTLLIFMTISLFVAILQMTSNKKSRSSMLIFSLLQILILITQRIAIQHLSDFETYFSVYTYTAWTAILFLFIIQFGLCWIGYFALKNNDDSEEDQPTSDSADNTMSSVVTNDSIEKQLNDCKHLFDVGLISEKEYEEKRKQILGL